MQAVDSAHTLVGLSSQGSPKPTQTSEPATRANSGGRAERGATVRERPIGRPC